MSKGSPKSLVLSLVERGWQAQRECSLDSRLSSTEFIHLVKGWLDRSVLNLIAPRPNIRLLGIPRRLFWPWVWVSAFWFRFTGNLHAILVDNERAFNRLWPMAACLGVGLFRVEMSPEGYVFWRGNQRFAWDEFQKYADCSHI
ncbi:MAG: hypothetical protein HYT88_02850 [Candidatus Omnitrophica bacterium]|nr:hypothetical protein [Candidatus Omnitrophota bacterium]MBI3009968.1 hypothetical protein [Candidatus Omnitrophota bacterium]